MVFVINKTVNIVKKEKTIDMKRKTKTWNYRVLVHEDNFSDSGLSFQVYEVYYKDKIPVSHTENPVKIYGESIEELESDLNLFERAFAEPILWADDKFPEIYKED